MKDVSFSITRSGEIVTEEHVSVRGGRTFSVWAQDNSGPGGKMVVHLHPTGIRDKQVRMHLFTAGVCMLEMS